MWGINLQIGDDVCPEQKLALAVLLLAVDDAKGKGKGRNGGRSTGDISDQALQREAEEWIATDNPDLEFWCGIAQLTPSTVRALLACPFFSGSKLLSRGSKNSMSALLGDWPGTVRLGGSGSSGGGRA